VKRGTWRLGVAVAALLGGFVRLALLLRPYQRIDQLFVPDDTYYTLSIARSMAHGHGPAADGHVLTSGFQALQGFLLVPVFWFTHDPATAARANLALLLAADTATIVVLGWLAYRLAGPVAGVVAALLWAGSPLALAMAAGGLETSLAMLLEVGLVAAWVWANDRSSTARWLVAGAVAGGAMLARVDAMLLVGLLAAVQVWRGPRRALAPAALSGAVVVGPWWLRCWWQFGSPLPTSGSAAHALAVGGPFTHQLLASAAGSVVTGPFGSAPWIRDRLWEHSSWGVAVFWVLVAALVVAGLAALVRGGGRRREGGAAVAGAGSLALFGAGLCLFYVWYGVPWYLSRYLAPVGLVATLGLAAMASRCAAGLRSRRGIVAAGVGAVGAMGVAAVLVTVAVAGAMLTRFDGSRRYQLDAAMGQWHAAEQALSAVPNGARVGAWQSGVLGYVADGRVTVVNLDGVVNPDAAKARRQRRTPEYVRAQRLGWVIDWMWFVIDYEQQRQDRGWPRDIGVRVIEVPGWPGPMAVVRSADP
jgi:hypothetical protein